MRTKNDIPSGFTMKLRKHLRSKKLDKIEQVGIDRVVKLTFGAEGANAFHLLIEFYASGNIILTDYEYNILSLLRTHKYDDSTKCAVKEKYPFTHAANLTVDSIVTEEENVRAIIAKSLEVQEESTEGGKKKKKNKKKATGSGNALKCLGDMVPYVSQPLAEHVFLSLSISQD
jgi:predicted ribosome quality control (RQC) complex YloA/Tae2 family protein